jgi:hypothetical protein
MSGSAGGLLWSSAKDEHGAALGWPACEHDSRRRLDEDASQRVGLRLLIDLGCQSDESRMS